MSVYTDYEFVQINSYCKSLYMAKYIHTKIRRTIYAVLTGILIVGVLLFAYRNDIFKALQDPGIPFQTYAKPIAPDYSQSSSWLALPDLSTDTFDIETPGDVFVVVPGVYRGGSHWVLPVDQEYRRERLQRIVRPNYVAPYGHAGRLFAPYYRHAAMYSYMTSREDAHQARNFAYRDVRRAFEYFLANSPPERPIIIAGHGQGADHATRLLADYFDGPLKSRLAAAYIIDHPLPEDLFENSLSHLTPCESESSVGCVVAYGMFLSSDDKNAGYFSTKALIHGSLGFEPAKNRPLLCVNPLTWTRTSKKADRALHKGGMAAVGIEPDLLPAPLTRQVSTQCKTGMLYVGKPKSRSLRRPFGIGARFWTLPSNLFFEDLRLNARLRADVLIETGDMPKRAKRLDDLDIVDIIESPIIQAGN